MPLWKRGAIFLAAASVTCVFFINFCNLMFRCGCESLWADAAAHCNIHTGPRHCPWCAIGAPGQAVVWLGMVAPQGWIAFASSWTFWPRLGVALAAFPGSGLVSALVVGLWTGYWS